MLELNKRDNLLEENDYKYQLQDVDEPKLYRELFEYTSVPKVSFNHRLVPQYMPENSCIPTRISVPCVPVRILACSFRKSPPGFGPIPRIFSW